MVQPSGSLFHPMLSEGEYGPHFFAYYYKRWEDYAMPFHSHPSTEIMCLITGSCTVEVAPPGKPAVSRRLKRGELIIIDAGIPHRLLVEDGMSCRMLNVEFGFRSHEGAGLSIGRLAASEPQVAAFMENPFDCLVLQGGEEIYFTLKSLVLELDQSGANPKTMAALLFGELLLRIARLRDEMQRSGRDAAGHYVKQATDYMRQNYDRPLRIGEIAEAVNLHPGYLQRLFKRHTDRTLTDFLNGLRMEKSAMLLARTDISVSEIADYAGIASRQYFHLLFKKYTGLTPVEYRKAADRHVMRYPAEDEEDGPESGR